MMTQGGRANRSGKVLERTVEATLREHGYFQVANNLPNKQRRDYILNGCLLPKRYARQVYIGNGIYGTDIYVDFYIIGLAAFPSGLIIECKWQQSGGSVDEKLPYVNLNIQTCYPVPSVVVIDGGGMKPGAVSWFHKQVHSNANLLAVHTLVSFMVWANNNL
ncbi:hypothetical protein NDA00_03620 [Funiculus sociatus GB2-M2]|nr:MULTISPECIES: PD-(D/E)XK nuclease superfamily protein [unclassified Trichocoleus]